MGSGIRLPASRRRSRTEPGRPIAISAPKNPDFWRQGSVQTEVRPGEIELRYRPYIYYGVYLFTVIAIISVLTEYISLRINRSHGERIPFLFNITPPVDPFLFNITSPVSLLDPNLGYAHGDTEPAVQRLKTRFSWLGSFAIYSNKPISQLDRPIILTLGGSTTDPVLSGHGWPEKLAMLFNERHVPATVINGATAGYSTNQELIKLIRDGIELHPDIVISYSGVNDRGEWGQFPNPMAHPYQRHLLQALLASKLSPLFPNTVWVLAKLIQRHGPSVQGYTLGLDTARSRGQWYERNLALMHAISEASGAKFFGVIQPNAWVGGYDISNLADLGVHPGQEPDIERLYSEISTLPQRLDYIRDFTAIFNGMEGVYRDGVHTTTEGDKIIAEHMFALITSTTAKVSHGTE